MPEKIQIKPVVSPAKMEHAAFMALGIEAAIDHCVQSLRGQEVPVDKPFGDDKRLAALIITRLVSRSMPTTPEWRAWFLALLSGQKWGLTNSSALRQRGEREGLWPAAAKADKMTMPEVSE